MTRRLFGRRRLLALASMSSAVVVTMAIERSSTPMPNGRRWVPDTSLARVVETGHFVVGIDPSYPPFESYGPESHPIGFDVELAAAVAPLFSSEVSFRPMGLDGLYDALRSSIIDAAISSLTPTWRAGKDIAFSDPYIDAGLVLCVKPPSPIRRLRDVAKRRIGVELGSEADDFFSEPAQRGLAVVVQRFDDIREALTSLVGDGLDASVTDAPTASLVRHDVTGYVVRLPPIAPKPYAIALRSDDQALIDAVNRALQWMRDHGKLDQLTRRWLGG